MTKHVVLYAVKDPYDNEFGEYRGVDELIWWADTMLHLNPPCAEKYLKIKRDVLNKMNNDYQIQIKRHSGELVYCKDKADAIDYCNFLIQVHGDRRKEIKDYYMDLIFVLNNNIYLDEVK